MRRLWIAVAMLVAAAWPACAVELGAGVAGTATASGPYAATDYIPLVRGGSGNAVKKIIANTIATLTDTQTLTAKTINCANNTCTVRIGSDVTGLGSNVAAWLADPTSAKLAAALTNETGSGAAVFGTGPTLSGVILSDITGSTQCLTADSSGAVTGTGSACGSGGGGGGDVTASGTLTSHAPLIGGGTTVAKATAALTNGQVLIGSTGADPVPATITMGAGLAADTGAGTYTITPAGRTAVADANCAALTNASSLIGFTTVLTAARSCTLPAASTMKAGQRLCFVDEGDGTNPAINSTNTVTINRAGSDKIVGATTLVMGVGYAATCLESDGSAKWGVVGNQNLGSQAATSNNFLTGLGSDGVFTRAQPSVSNTSGFGTGVATALGVNVGSSGAPVVLNGALGTPSSGTGTNITGIPNNNVLATTLATGTSVSLTAPREYYICTGTCTVTPPVPAVGYEFCVMNDDNVATVITLAAIGSSARYEATARTSYGTAGTGTFISGGAAGDKVCLLGRDSTHYLTVSFNGTWTAN